MMTSQPNRRGMAALGRCRRGGAAVEAALLLPVLILLGFGALDAALLVQQTHRMEAGLGAAGAFLSQGSATPEDQTRAQNIAVTGQGAPGGTPALGGWRAQDVAVSVRSADAQGEFRAGTARVAELSSSIPFKGLGVIRGASGGTVDVSARYQVRLAQ